jgi:hypothetical protein
VRCPFVSAAIVHVRTAGYGFDAAVPAGYFCFFAKRRARAPAQDGTPFYREQTLRIVISTGVAGGFEACARLLTEHFGGSAGGREGSPKQSTNRSATSGFAGRLSSSRSSALPKWFESSPSSTRKWGNLSAR